jgi:hypothetical protein
MPNDDSDVINIDGSVKIVVDIKEEREAVKKYNVGDGENGKGDKIKVSAPEVMAVLAEENPAKQTKGSKGPDNKESQPQPQKRKGNDTVVCMTEGVCFCLGDCVLLRGTGLCAAYFWGNQTWTY